MDGLAAHDDDRSDGARRVTMSREGLRGWQNRCKCGKPKNRRAETCLVCLTRKRTETLGPIPWKNECACGRLKMKDSIQCRACFNEQCATSIPPICQCINRGTLSPWHCQCERWKPSTLDYCEVCQPTPFLSESPAA